MTTNKLHFIILAIASFLFASGVVFMIHSYISFLQWHPYGVLFVIALAGLLTGSISAFMFQFVAHSSESVLLASQLLAVPAAWLISLLVAIQNAFVDKLDYLTQGPPSFAAGLAIMVAASFPFLILYARHETRKKPWITIAGTSFFIAGYGVIMIVMQNMAL